MFHLPGDLSAEHRSCCTRFRRTSSFQKVRISHAIHVVLCAAGATSFCIARVREAAKGGHGTDSERGKTNDLFWLPPRDRRSRAYARVGKEWLRSQKHASERIDASGIFTRLAAIQNDRVNFKFPRTLSTLHGGSTSR